MTNTTSQSLRQSSLGKWSKQHFKVCFCFKRIFKLKVPEPPQEICTLWEKYSQIGSMSVDDLCRFFVEVQGEKGGDATKKHAQDILNGSLHIEFKAFFRYLFSDLNGPLPLQVHQNMNSPLAHYFLYTGHNSYLTGNQFCSESSTSLIIEALKKGVRVIELDLWPNKKWNDVVVRHGCTLTSSVKLEACLNAIKKYAFDASPYPVIITFEDHITPSLQTKVAKMVDGIFGEMLFRPDSPQMNKYPSPESLKGKILISTKPPESPENDGKKVQDKGAKRLDDNKDDSNDTGEEDDTRLEYRNLISIHAWKPKGKLENCLVRSSQVRRLSLSEQELEDIATKHGTKIVRFTQTNLLRIYPKGLRLDSSNYNPLTGWLHGAQMVAFNMQKKCDPFLRIMEGMFRANGGCGYVKKPDILLNVGQNNEVFDPRGARPIKKTLQVSIYMGEGWHSDFGLTHFDFYSPPDFYVKVRIHGVPDDRHTEKTTTIKNEWAPIWNEMLFSFSLRVPELAFLNIKVIDRDDSGKHDFGGQTCLPVSELREGIRAVRLYDQRGEFYKSVRLLIKFRFVNNSNSTA